MKYHHFEGTITILDTCLEVSGVIFGIHDENDPEEIGNAHIFIFDETYTGDGLIEDADAISEDCFLAMQSVEICDFEDEPSSPDTLVVWGRVAVLERLKIDDRYQNRGIGTEAMNEILDWLSKISVEFVILRPCPLEFLRGDKGKQAELADGIQRLTNFYSRFGFRKTVGSLSMKEFHMCKRLL